jgi:preprotein translocase subunit Sec63
MPSAASPESDVQELVEAYKVLGLELNASTDAIEHWYGELSLLNQPDRHPAGSADRQRAGEKRRQIDAAYGLIQNAPLQNHPLAKEAAAREEERVPDPGLLIDRPVSVATEVIVRFVFGVVVGLFVASALNARGLPGFEFYVWGVPLIFGILFMSSNRPILGGPEF